MKKLIAATILVITILLSSFVFVNFSIYLMKPAIADNLCPAGNEWEHDIFDQTVPCPLDPFDSMYNNIDEQENIEPDQPSIDKQCSSICPINTNGAKG